MGPSRLPRNKFPALAIVANYLGFRPLAITEWRELEGGSGKDVLLLDGTLKDYAIQVTKTGGTDHGRCGRDGYRVKASSW